MANKPKGIQRTRTPIVGYQSVVVNGKEDVVPVTKTGKIPKDFLRAVNSTRTSKQRKTDGSKQATVTYGRTVSAAQAQKWMSKPSKYDVRNVDTPKKKR